MHNEFALSVTPFDIAQRFVGVKEAPGEASNPHVLAMLNLDAKWPKGDDVPWCSSYCNYVCWLLRVPRSKSLRARSWLSVGRAISLEHAKPGFDVVILRRGKGKQPGPENTTAPGHVGFYAGEQGMHVLVLGGNQKDAVNVQAYSRKLVLGVRRL